MRRISYSYRFKYGYYQFLDKIFGRKTAVKRTLKGRKKLFEKISEQLKKSGPRKLYDVKRVDSISIKEFKRNYLRKNIPVVISAGAIGWDCVKNWSLDYFRELHGDDEVTIVANDATEEPFEIIKLKTILDNIQKGGSKYYRFYPLLKHHPEHIADFDYTWLRKAKNKFGFWEQFQVFIGGKGTYTPVHNAMASNIFVQVYGEKEWILYPPTYTSIIDPEPGVNFHRGAPFKTSEGPFNPFKPNYNTPYSLFAHLDGIKVNLKPGDIFFNPPHYWHAVENPSDSIGVGYRWLSPRSSFLSAPFYTFLDLINAPFNKNIYVNMKKDYNLVHLMELGVYKDYEKKKRKHDKTK